MQADQLKQRIDSIEECADEAKDALQAGSVNPQLRQSVESLHQRAKQAQQQAGSGQQMGQDQLREPILQLEQAADQAMQACRQAGTVDQKLQQAVQRAHQEASSLKKQIQMG